VRHGGSRLDWSAPNVLIGRPVRFAGFNPDDGLAMRRYRAAFGKLGADHARYVYEPVGAPSSTRSGSTTTPRFWWRISAAAPATSR
jgi:hypothetical protein